MNNIVKIQAGQVLTAKSVCDSNCIFSAEVISRTEKTATVRIDGQTKRCKIHLQGRFEMIYALGVYSMCPVFKAIEVTEAPVALTTRKIQDALNSDFFLDAEQGAIVEAATAAGYVRRISHTQAEWISEGLVRLEDEMKAEVCKATGLNENQVEDNDVEKYFELIGLTKQVACFEFEGVLFQGYYQEAVATYIRRRPYAKFFIWLQDHYNRLN